MKTIYKYELEVRDGVQIRAISRTGIVRRVAMQGAKLCIWVEVDPDFPTVDRGFVVVGTGHHVDGCPVYCGSCDQGPFVWHVFEVEL